MKTDSPKMKNLFGGDVSGGFFDLPLGKPGDATDLDIVVLGAPAATPYGSVGHYCDDAPRAVRSAFGWPGVLSHHDFDIDGYLLPEGVNAADWGDIDWSQTDFAHNRRTISDTVSTVLAGGAVPLVIGGDDSIPVPILNGYEASGPVCIFC